MFAISPEDFIASHTIEQDHDVEVVGRLREQVSIDGSRVRKWLIQVPDHSWQQFIDLRLNLQLMICEAEPLCDLRGIIPVWRHALELLIFGGELDSERMHGLLRVDTHKCADYRGVQSTAQEHTNWDVSPHLQPDRVCQQRIELFNQPVFAGRLLGWIQAPVPLDR